MHLTYVALRNFGPFLGEHILDLTSPSDGDGAFHLVGGRNGSGKTTILQALYLLWYGPRSPYMKQAGGGWCDYRTNLITKQAEGSACIRTELTVGLGRERTTLRTELTWDHITASRAPHYVVHRNGRPDALLSQRWLALAEELLPLALAPLFWSDGEHVADSLENQDIDASFSSAVRAVLGLHITDPLISALEQIASKTFAQKASGNAAQELAQHEQEIRGLEQRRRVIAQDIASVRTLLRYRLRRTQPSVEAEGSQSASEAVDIRGKLRDLARGPLALLPLTPVLERACLWVEEVVEERDVATDNRILFDKRDLHLLKKFLHEFGPRVAAEAQATLKRAASSPTCAQEPHQEPRGVEGPEADTRSHQRKLARLESELETLNQQLTRVHHARQCLIRSSTNVQRDQLMWERRLNGTLRVKGVLQAFAAQIAEKRLHTLESELNDALQLFAYKGRHLGRLRLDPGGGQIRLVAANGEPVPTQHLSAGERQLLLLVMMWGLRKSSGVSVPLIMDTLLARLDLDHRARLLTILQQQDGVQVVLFATDGEVAWQQVHGTARSVRHLIEHVAERKESRILRSCYFDNREAPRCSQKKLS